MDKEAIFDRYQDGLRRYIPAHMHGEVHRYVMHGARPGEFLYLLMCDRDEAAMECADRVNAKHKNDWLVVLARYLPPECHGTGEKVQTWIDHKGLDGSQ